MSSNQNNDLNHIDRKRLGEIARGIHPTEQELEILQKSEGQTKKTRRVTRTEQYGANHVHARLIKTSYKKPTINGWFLYCELSEIIEVVTLFFCFYLINRPII